MRKVSTMITIDPSFSFKIDGDLFECYGFGAKNVGIKMHSHPHGHWTHCIRGQVGVLYDNDDPLTILTVDSPPLFFPANTLHGFCSLSRAAIVNVTKAKDLADGE